MESSQGKMKLLKAGMGKKKKKRQHCKKSKMSPSEEGWLIAAHQFDTMNLGSAFDH